MRLLNFEREREMYRVFADYGYVAHAKVSVAIMLVSRLATVAIVAYGAFLIVRLVFEAGAR